MTPYPIGESCLCWPLGDDISAATSGRVLRLYRAVKRLHNRCEMGILDVVPSCNSLAIHFDPPAADLPRIHEAVESILGAADDGAQADGKLVTLPIRYDGPDLARVAEHAGITPEEVIRLHAGGKYVVAMIGFLPHFPYLIGLPERLATPRLSSPRTRVPAGAVGIGGAQTGVYPVASPGGWNIIGTTDPDCLPALEPADQVRFEKR